MGSINKIFLPKNWIIENECESKLIPGDIIYKMNIGKCDDEISYSNITYFISKSVYEEILNGMIRVKSFAYSMEPILLYDEFNNLISPIKGVRIDTNELDDIKKDFCKKLKKDRSRSDKKR